MTEAPPWWVGGSLRAGAEGLMLADRSVAALAQESGTPVYLYDQARIAEAVATLRTALAPFRNSRIYFALKANRFAPIVQLLRAQGVGIDACSPREVALARELGFPAASISATASSLSEEDVVAFANSGVHLNLDNAGTARRYGAMVPHGTTIGIRVDPGVSAGYGVNGRTDYGGGKLGVAPEGVGALVEAARTAGLAVDTLHMHLGWGLRGSAKPAFRRALSTLADMSKAIGTITCVNVGGGLGGRLREADKPLEPERWAAAIHDAFGSDGPSIACEPGTFLVASAGILLARVTAVWDKRGQHWIGLDASQAVNVYAAHYGLELEIVPVESPLAPRTRMTNVAGNINEAGDVFARARLLPDLAEGDLVALLPAGAYGSSMASDHCLRGGFSERLL